MFFKSDINQVVGRLRKLYQHEAQDQIFAVMKVPSYTLKQFADKHHEGYCDYPDPLERIYFWDQFLKETSEIEDDRVPSAYLSEFDQGLYGALVGGMPRFICDPSAGKISSMIAPFLNDWEDFKNLKYDETNMWYIRYIEQLEIFRLASQGKFGISHFIMIDSLNFIFELRGATQTFLDLIDYPEMVKETFEFAYRLNKWVMDVFFKHVGMEFDGTCSNFAQWVPGRVVSESVDPFHLTGAEYFEIWGRAPIERIFNDYDGGLIHLHGNGRHLLNSVRTLKGLKAIRFLEDRGYPLAFDLREQLRRTTGNVPLIMDVTYENFIQALADHSLPGGILYYVQNVPGRDTANRSMEKVREYRV